MNYINGLWQEGQGDALVSTDPSSGAVVWQGRAASAAQVHEAVAAARAAFPAWAALGYEKRRDVLRQVKASMEKEQAALTELIARETGKLLWDAKTEAAAVVGKFAFAEAAYLERTGEKRSYNEILKQELVLRHRPHGVMAVYGPYNFPAHLPNGHIVPSLLAGNTIVFKPSEFTPGVADFMIRHWESSGIPAGVINLVQGEAEVGKALASADIQGLLFTGSSATGKRIHAQFAGKPEIMLALELGGNNALIVYNPQNLRAAVRETILSSFLSSGQRCTCARKVILPKWKQRDEFIALLLKSISALKVGKWDDGEESFMGPLVSNREAERVLHGQSMMESKGGRVLARAERLHPTLPYMSPGVIDVTGVVGIPDEEYFGPLLQIVQVEDAEEAWRVANATQYGLSAGVLSADHDFYLQAVEKLHVGLINWNRQTTGASGSAPFGGVGCSGNHRAAGYYAADYCAYPLASIEVAEMQLPEQLEPGLNIP